jgi:hypothetical protein
MNVMLLQIMVLPLFQEEYGEDRALPTREELVARIRDAPCRGENEFEEEYNRTETRRLADEAAFEAQWEEERKVSVIQNQLLHIAGKTLLLLAPDSS